MKDKLNEYNFDETRDGFNGFKVNYIDTRGKELLHLSLTGAGMDFYIKSEYTDKWFYGDYDKNKGTKEDRYQQTSGRIAAATKLKEDAQNDIQEILDAYLVIIEARMRKLDQDLVHLSKTMK